MKNRSGQELLKGYTTIHNLLSERRLAPKMHYLENECPKVLQQLMTEKKERFQLVPPHLHRRNSAERAIQMFKNHFIAGLASVKKNFPFRIWCRLLPHCLLALNLLCPSRINPKLSAYSQLHGAFDFNRTLLAPPGTKIIIHNKPAIRGSWATRGYEGWCIGPALNHYRCHTVYAIHTAHERVTANVEFFQHYRKMPYRSSTENATIAAPKSTHALQNYSPASPFSNVGDKQMKALHQLAEIFQQTVTKDNNTPTSVAPPRMSPTQEAHQTRVPIITTPTHNAHPHLPNIIKDDHGNQPLGLDHGTQPL